MRNILNPLCVTGCLSLAIGCGADGLGVGAGSDTVEAILRVNREIEPHGSTADFHIYRETQASLLKSQYVVRAALGSDDIDELEGLTAKVLSDSIDVGVPADSELIFVRMTIAGREPNDAKKILNAVIDAYQSEILNKDRLEKADLLARLRKRYQTLFETVKKKTDEISQLAKQLGTTDRRIIDAQTSVIVGVGAKQVQFLHRKLVDLNLQRMENADDPTELATIEKQIKYIEEQIESQESQIVWSGELDARMEDLVGIRKDLQEVRSSMRDLEMELDGPRRVTVIQPASIAK